MTARWACAGERGTAQPGPGGRRERVPGAGRALPAGAPAPLLPDRRLGAGRRGSAAGDAARRLARARPVPGARLGSRLAVPDRDQPLPECPARPQASPTGGTLDDPAARADPHGRADLARAIPRRPARGGRGRGRQGPRPATRRGRRSGSHSSPRFSTCRRASAPCWCCATCSAIGTAEAVAEMLGQQRGLGQGRAAARAGGARDAPTRRAAASERRCRTRRASESSSAASPTRSSTATPRGWSPC